MNTLDKHSHIFDLIPLNLKKKCAKKGIGIFKFIEMIKSKKLKSGKDDLK